MSWAAVGMTSSCASKWLTAPLCARSCKLRRRIYVLTWLYINRDAYSDYKTFVFIILINNKIISIVYGFMVSKKLLNCSSCILKLKETRLLLEIRDFSERVNYRCSSPVCHWWCSAELSCSTLWERRHQVVPRRPLPLPAPTPSKTFHEHWSSEKIDGNSGF